MVRQFVLLLFCNCLIVFVLVRGNLKVGGGSGKKSAFELRSFAIRKEGEVTWLFSFAD